MDNNIIKIITLLSEYVDSENSQRAKDIITNAIDDIVCTKNACNTYLSPSVISKMVKIKSLDWTDPFDAGSKDFSTTGFGTTIGSYPELWSFEIIQINGGRGYKYLLCANKNYGNKEEYTIHCKSIEVAKGAAQDIWNQYLQQYLEPYE